ncbi:Protein of unknown function [Cotesia congregata]|uniref:Uncharacterized protein n=1 Tax=Cotesia congregata TaxID=51543 RepID=A0A8J2MJ19_COTCN|nr:Protein of unknown function [Cotesia congregata]
MDDTIVTPTPENIVNHDELILQQQWNIEKEMSKLILHIGEEKSLKVLEREYPEEQVYCLKDSRWFILCGLICRLPLCRCLIRRPTLIIMTSMIHLCSHFGFWKLTSQNPPELLIARNEQAISDRKRLAKSYQVQDQQHLDQSSANFPAEESSSNSYGDSSRTVTSSMFSRKYVQPSEILSDFFFADDEAPGSQEPNLNLENRKFVVKNEQDLDHILIDKDQGLDLVIYVH